MKKSLLSWPETGNVLITADVISFVCLISLKPNA